MINLQLPTFLGMWNTAAHTRTVNIIRTPPRLQANVSISNHIIGKLRINRSKLDQNKARKVWNNQQHIQLSKFLLLLLKPIGKRGRARVNSTGSEGWIKHEGFHARVPPINHSSPRNAATFGPSCMSSDGPNPPFTHLDSGSDLWLVVAPDLGLEERHLSDDEDSMPKGTYKRELRSPGSHMSKSGNTYLASCLARQDSPAFHIFQLVIKMTNVTAAGRPKPVKRTQLAA
ncbi:hypothetical protein C8J56DRAFT_898441 [Mycena floridula]|nr:hypothetical protein C8J56DRAFT_898441 [Mycena floridula]